MIARVFVTRTSMTPLDIVQTLRDAGREIEGVEVEG